MNTLFNIIFTLVLIAISAFIFISFATIGFAIVGILFTLGLLAYTYNYFKTKRSMC